MHYIQFALGQSQVYVQLPYSKTDKHNRHINVRAVPLSVTSISEFPGAVLLPVSLGRTLFCVGSSSGEGGTRYGTGLGLGH